jgi:hypothetical protein
VTDIIERRLGRGVGHAKLPKPRRRLAEAGEL